MIEKAERIAQSLAAACLEDKNPGLHLRRKAQREAGECHKDAWHEGGRHNPKNKTAKFCPPSQCRFSPYSAAWNGRLLPYHNRSDTDDTRVGD